MVLEYGVGAAAIAGGWSAYFRSFLEGIGIHIPTALSGPFNPEKGTYFDILAVLIILIIMGLLCKGMKESLRITNIMVFIKLAVILLFVVFGTFYVKPENWTPFMPFGFVGISAGAAIVFFSYIGFDAVSSAAEEVKNPQKNMPIGIICSLTIVTTFYISVSLVLTGIVLYEMLNVSAPVAFALQFIGQDWLAGLLSLGAIVGITTILLGLLYGQSRLFLALSRDGLLPTFFSNINSKTKTPIKSTLLTGLLVALISGLVPLARLVEIINIGTLTSFCLVALGVLVFRKKHPEVKRGFKVSLIPIIPLLSIVACGYLIFNLPLVTFMNFVIWITIGLIIYFMYGYKHSILGKNQINKVEIMKVSNKNIEL